MLSNGYIQESMPFGKFKSLLKLSFLKRKLLLRSHNIGNCLSFWGLQKKEKSVGKKKKHRWRVLFTRLSHVLILSLLTLAHRWPGCGLLIIFFSSLKLSFLSLYFFLIILKLCLCCWVRQRAPHQLTRLPRGASDNGTTFPRLFFGFISPTLGTLLGWLFWCSFFLAALICRARLMRIYAFVEEKVDSLSPHFFHAVFCCCVEWN